MQSLNDCIANPKQNKTSVIVSLHMLDHYQSENNEKKIKKNGYKYISTHCLVIIPDVIEYYYTKLANSVVQLPTYFGTNTIQNVQYFLSMQHISSYKFVCGLKTIIQFCYIP